MEVQKKLALVFIFLVSMTLVAQPQQATGGEVELGERLFKEWRFSQFFAQKSSGRVNFLLQKGDPILQEIKHFSGFKTASPFRQQSISCASCHIVDQMVDRPGFGMRGYSEFTRRSRIPDRGDGQTLTLRNSPALIGLAKSVSQQLLHFDGEFATMEDLVIGGLTGRNFGWLATEKPAAIKQIIQVIREDDGRGELAEEFGGQSYHAAFLDVLGLDVAVVAEQKVIDSVAKLVSSYVNDIDFDRDENGSYQGSPYDQFLRINQLPLQPEEGESEVAYSRRLLSLIEEKEKTENLRFFKRDRFQFHDQDFQFLPEELEGLKIFFAEKNENSGACIACHPAPDFKDDLCHNIGVSQFDYDLVHRKREEKKERRFLELAVPSLSEREQSPEKYRKPNLEFPARKAKMAQFPSLEDNEFADLGIWTYYLNPDYPKQQKVFEHILSEVYGFENWSSLTNEQKLPLTIGLFKTPTLRNLGHSAPYFHSGRAPTLINAIAHYLGFGRVARRGHLRNVDPRVKDIHLDKLSLEPLEKFLKALNEDYE